MTVLGTLASFVADADATALPDPQQAAQRRHILDTLIATAAGARTAEGHSLASLFASRAQPERIGQRAAAIRLSEIDDIHLPSCTTPSSAAVAVALSLAAETSRCDPARVAGAIWAGTEAMTRMGEAARGPEILYRGIWPSYLAAPLAAAASAARMQGLDAARTADALSLALMLTAGGVGRVHASPSARWVLFAMAVAAGVTAVEAVQAGYAGDPGLLDGSWFEDTHGIPLDRERLTGGLGASSIYTALSMKPFCSAKQSIAAAQALRRILSSGIAPDAVSKIVVRVPPAYAQMISQKPQAGSRSSTLVSVARQLALVAHDPARLYDVDRVEPVTDPTVLSFEAMVEIVAEKDLQSFYPKHWPAEVEVTAASKTLRERVIEANGDPEKAFGDEALDDKAHRVLDRLVGNAAANELIETGRHGFDGDKTCKALADAFVRCFDPPH